MPTNYSLKWGCFLGLTMVLTGCNQEEAVRTYKAPKSPQASAQRPGEMPEMASSAAAGAAVMAETGGVQPHLHWTAPPGWKEQAPGSMRLASFAITGPSGQKADMSVVPLSGASGSELDNVNRWRGQLKLSPIDAVTLARERQAVEIAGQTGQVYDLAGTTDAGTNRILAAMLSRGNTTWFFKMMGDNALVAAQKPAFLTFLKSVEIDEGTHGEAAPAPAPIQSQSQSQSAAAAPTTTAHAPTPSSAPAPSLAPASAPAAANAATSAAAPTPDAPAWTPPSTWQAQAAGPMVHSTFAAVDKTGGKAMIAISVFPGDVGGPLANLNRWRRQVGLEPVGQADLAKQFTLVDLADGQGKASVAELEGQDARSGEKVRLVVAMVPRKTQTWFYKMTGNPATVAEEKAAFVKFVQTVRYSDGQ